MTQGEPASPERRLLVLTPTARDAELTQAILERAGIACVCCTDLDGICAELRIGAAAALVPEECFVAAPHGGFFEWIESQEPWSDLPVLVLARRGADSPAVARAMERIGNVIVLERPTRVSALVSAARSAIRARQRQYQIREHLAEREARALELIANDRRKDEFLAILAHELRNPLAPLVNSVHLLRLGHERDIDAAKIHEMMDRQIRHMVRLVDDLLEVSRITRGKIELRREPVDLVAVIRAALDSVRPLAEIAQRDLEASLPPFPLIVDADVVRLGQVFSNLLNNAVKYTTPGGRILVEIAAGEDSVVASIRDNGSGIEREMLVRVFDPFTQAHRREGGLGIGLTLVQRLVEMHGGTVTAHSEGPGAGSEFVVRLPLATSNAVNARPAEMPELEGLASRRVLVVDDNRDAADSMASLLRVLGADVEAVYGGAEALEKIESYHPSVVLLDVGMPGMDGLEVARRVRRRPECRDIALVALTGWGQERDRHRTKASGFDHHLTKPADLATLASLFASLGPADAGAAHEPVSS